MNRKSLMIHPNDNVAMVLEDCEKGDTVNVNNDLITLLEDVEFAHKVAIVSFKAGDPVIKYGEEIGYALTDISVGSWIHNHNLGCDRGRK